jgi:ABC-type nitrate/sulfonate/bicarbonate transport system permease component
MLMLFIIWACSRNAGNYPFALTPLLAVGILAETGRSYRWKMAELEYAARFSLRSIVLARMFLVGLIDTAGLLIVTAAVRSHLTYSLLRVFLYMMVPYLLAAFLGSLYERKKRTDAGLGSIVICLLSSAVFAAAPIFMSSLYEESLTIIWAAAFILLICCLAVSVREQMREMEEPVWN